MPNLVFAIAIDGDTIHSINSDFCRYVPMDFCGLTGDWLLIGGCLPRPEACKDCDMKKKLLPFEAVIDAVKQVMDK